MAPVGLRGLAGVIFLRKSSGGFGWEVGGTSEYAYEGKDFLVDPPNVRACPNCRRMSGKVSFHPENCGPQTFLRGIFT